jgi:amino acid transporter
MFFEIAGTMDKHRKERIGLWGVVAIGVGGMVGGGIFAVLGLAVQLAHGGTPIAFLVAGLVALVTSYSYARLSVTYPSQGGTVEFVNQAFGVGLFTGALNILLWISYVVMLSLYAYAFGSYGASFMPAAFQPAGKHLLISGVIVLFTVLNVLGSSKVGEAEEWIVGLKIAILALFIVVGLWSVESGRIAPSTWASFPQLIAGGMIIFLAYEGFELIANAARDVANPSSALPRAYYISVIFVIILYVLVSLVTVGNLSIGKIVAARDYALAESAKPFLGATGFMLIAIAALLSTGSAINATLYGAARISYVIAKDGELPDILERKIWHRPVEGLFITCGLALLVANLLNLSSISVMGSAGFLLIFSAVNASNMRLHRETKSGRWLSGIGVFACLSALAILVWQRVKTAPNELWVLVVMLLVSFAIEVVYKKIAGRVIRPVFQRSRGR